jgi:hypothetical protein
MSNNYLINGGMNFFRALGTTIGNSAIAVGTTNGSTAATIASTATLYPGMSIKSANIPTGTTIASITNATDFVLSANATATASASASFGIADDKYGPDMWTILHNGDAPVVVSRSTTIPDGKEARYSAKFVVSANGAGKQFGMVNFLENRATLELILKQISAGFLVKSTAANLVNKVRAAIIGWTSTADSVTSDVVATWAGAGTTPTLANNWTFVSPVLDCSLSGFWSNRFIATTESVPSNVTNLALFIWVDDTDLAAGDELYITQAYLQDSVVPMASYQLAGGDITHEEELCQSYFMKSFKRDTGCKNAITEANHPGALAYYCHTAGIKIAALPVNFPIAMRTEAPAMTFYSPVAYDAKWYNVTGSAVSGTAAAEHTTANGFNAVNPQAAADAAQSEAVVHYTADARL